MGFAGALPILRAANLRNGADTAYGFRARRFAAPRNDESRPHVENPNLPVDNYVKQNYTSPQPVPSPGDETRSSRSVGAGCDGRLLRQCDANRADENAAAYGEVVWSWRRDPGVYLARSVSLTTVTIKAAHRGEHEVNRKAIARGKPGCLGCTCQTRVRSLLPIAHGDAGAVGARLSLRPLWFRGTMKMQTSGGIAP
jgi:hypothetical protein